MRRKNSSSSLSYKYATKLRLEISAEIKKIFFYVILISDTKLNLSKNVDKKPRLIISPRLREKSLAEMESVTERINPGEITRRGGAGSKLLALLGYVVHFCWSFKILDFACKINENDFLCRRFDSRSWKSRQISSSSYWFIYNFLKKSANLY